jgi:hypothetical protein
MGQVEAGAVVINVKANLATFKQGMRDGSAVATRETKKLAGEIKGQMQEARGSIALLGEEVGVHVPRHLQTVIAKLPGVGTAFAAAFSSVAILAIIEVIVKLVEKIKAAREASEKAGKDWEVLKIQTLGHADALRLANVQLENAIAKFKNKPEDHVKQALAEAVVEADKLAASLEKDITEIEKLFKEQHIGFWSKLFGNAGADDVEKTVTDKLNNVKQITEDFNEKIRTTTDAKQREKIATEAATAAQKSYGEALKFLNTELDKANDLQKEREENSKKVTSFDRFGNERHEGNIPDDQSKRIALIKNALTELRNEADVTGLSFQGFALNIEKGVAESAADLEKMSERVRKLHAEIESLFDKFREHVETPFEKVAREANEAEDKIRQMAKDNPELFKKAFPNDGVDSVVRSMRNLALAAEDKELDKALVELNKQFEELQKHARLPKDALFGQGAPALPTLASDAKGRDANQKLIDEIKAGGVKGEEAAEKAAEKIRDAVETENQKYKEQLQILELLRQKHLISDEEFKKRKEQLSGEAADWKQLGADIGKTIEQAALFGRSWTDALKSILIQVVELILKMTVLKNVGGASGGSGVGGFFGSLLSGLVGGKRAGGGDVAPGKGYWVGEKGPEWFSPDSAGAIVPNNAIGGGGDVYHIDARGADAGVEQRVHRAIRESENRAVARSVTAVSDRNRRKV